MNIAKIDALLLEHPFIKDLSVNERLSIYNKVYNKIFTIRNDITIINPVQYSTDKSIKIHHQFPLDLNLSAHKDLDYLMEQHTLLKNLTEQQKIVIFEIAAYKINIYRTLREDQEYFFNTHKEDTYYRIKRWFQPILTATSKILSYTTKTIIFQPLLTVNASVLSLLSRTKYFNPLLTVTSKIWTLANYITTFNPLAIVTATIIQDKNTTVVLLPLAIVSYLIINGSKNINVTFNPLLSAEYSIITDADYTQSTIFQPLLTMSYQITK